MSQPRTTTIITRSKARSLQMPLTELLSPSYTRLFHDTYVSADQMITLRTRAAAVLARLPAAQHISHHTAVQIWGGIAPMSPDIHVSMATRDARCRRSGVAAHLAGQTVRTTEHQGLRISTPIQAFLDLASLGVSLVELVIAGDSLVKATGLKLRALVAAADTWLGRNAKRARRAASLVREGVDSPMETRLRLLIVFAGLPEPQVNLIITDENGNWHWRFDLCYPEWKLIIEYDGRQHAFDQDQWGHDVDRREELDRLGWRLVIIGYDGIYGDPHRTLRRIRSALEERGAKAMPRVFKQEWVRHFVSR